MRSATNVSTVDSAFPARRSSHAAFFPAAVIWRVVISNRATKQLRRLPKHVVAKLAVWVAAVESDGLEVPRQVRGFHDEPLRGPRIRQRSVRLSRSYRAIYAIRHEELSRHEY